MALIILPAESAQSRVTDAGQIPFGSQLLPGRHALLWRLWQEPLLHASHYSRIAISRVDPFLPAQSALSCASNRTAFF